MKPEWRVHVWGVRGSAPRPSPDCMEYGGNTVCTSLEEQEHIVVLDAGTGLSALGQSLSGRRAVKRLDILLSHVHIDHVLGLFSFPPLFDPEMEIHFYGTPGLAQALNGLVAPPFWPLRIGESPARLMFHEIGPGDCFALHDLSVSTMAGNHPGGSLLYRLDGAGKCLTYLLDCETEERIFPALAGFAQGSGLLIWDANFTRSNLRPGWGHSTWEQGLELGRAAQAGQVLMTHYNWKSSDGELRQQEQLAKPAGICRFAREGMVIAL